jgi:hypothetical protein
MTPKVRETLNTIIERFKSGDIPEAVAYSMFPIPNLPSSRWSLLNRTLMFFSWWGLPLPQKTAKSGMDMPYLAIVISS